MRTIFVPPLDQEHSVLGFGCASMGSRVSPQQSQKALALAFERGITWYDVAPPYGDGSAESILGTFLKGRRDRVAVCTKAGIQRPQPPLLKRMLRPAARFAVKAFPNMRGGVALMRRPNMQVTMTPQTLEASVIESLRHLQTDYIDVLALHEPSVTVCEDLAIAATLERLIAKGYVRSASIAGSIEAAIVGAEASSIFQFAQFQDSPFLAAIDRLHANAAARNRFAITHSVFGGGAFEGLSKLMETSKTPADSQIVSGLLFDYALAKNPNGIVLSSMFSQNHIDANCARAAAPVNGDAVAHIENLMVSK